MYSSHDIKKAAKSFGADLAGIAPMDRFEGAPKQMDPRYIFPEAKTMLVLGYRIPRGVFRPIEEGTHFGLYSSMGYAALNQVYGPMVLWKLSRFIEDCGFVAVPMPNLNGGEAVNPVNGKFRKHWSVPVAEGRPYPDVLVHQRIAAFCAGLGEIGYSNLFLTPEYGPRQRFNLLLTDMPLEPDPLFEGKICDRCKLCVARCPGKALSPTKMVRVKIAGRELEWAELDPLACERGIQGGEKNEVNPFLVDYPRVYGYGRSVEGACGCIRACMAHLDEKGVLTCRFKNRFPKPKPWRVDQTQAPALTEDVKQNYLAKGKMEEWSEYSQYNAQENCGQKDRTKKSGQDRAAITWPSMAQENSDSRFVD